MMSGIKRNPRQWLKEKEREEAQKKKEVKMKDKLYSEYMELQKEKKAKAMDRMLWRTPRCHTRQHPSLRKMDKKTRDRIAKQEGFIDFCKFSTLSEEKEAYKKAKKEGKEGNGFYLENQTVEDEEEGDHPNEQ